MGHSAHVILDIQVAAAHRQRGGNNEVWRALVWVGPPGAGAERVRPAGVQLRPGCAEGPGRGAGGRPGVCRGPPLCPSLHDVLVAFKSHSLAQTGTRYPCHSVALQSPKGTHFVFSSRCLIPLLARRYIFEITHRIFDCMGQALGIMERLSGLSGGAAAWGLCWTALG